MRSILGLILASLAVAAARADEAVLPDGRRLPGELRFISGRLQFVGKDRTFRLDEVHHVRLSTDAPALRADVIHRVLLRDGGQLTGEFTALDPKTLQWRTAWAAQPLTIPRTRVALLHPQRRTADDPRQPIADPGQDATVLLSGDELFGRVLRADGRTVEMEGRFGKREFPWKEVRAVHLKPEAATAKTTDGEHVRIRLKSGAGREADLLEGAVQSLDSRRLVLQHPALGEVSIDRAYLTRIGPVFYGRRVEVDTGAHHLGRRVLAGMPAPEGISLKRTFTLPAEPKEAFLVVEVAHLKGPGDGPTMARALERGARRLEIVVNGRVVDYLNRHGERSAPEPRRLRIGLPRAALKTGENVIELRQTPDRETEQYEDCLLLGLAVELPR